METSLMVYDYPMAPESDETNITIYLKVETSDIFPETWDKEQIEDYVKANIKDYLYNSDDIEVHEINI